jgi:hypothetical protein
VGLAPGRGPRVFQSYIFSVVHLCSVSARVILGRTERARKIRRVGHIVLAGNRKPGPVGIDGVDGIDDGTLCRSASHPPGTSHSDAGSHKSSNRHLHPQGGLHPGKPAISAGDLLVRYGDRGVAVRTLQALLNVHVEPGPNLRVDGKFGTQTLAALKKFQNAQHLRADGMAGKATWHRLMYPSNIARIVQPNIPEDVSVWPMHNRVAEVIRLLPGKLPTELWSQLRGLMSTDLLVLGVAAYAASHLFGVGELIDLGILLIVGEQAFFELAECVQIIVLAMSLKDLDEAATHLARAISIIGIYKFATLLAGLLKNRSAGGEKPPTDSNSRTEPTKPPRTVEPEPPPRNPAKLAEEFATRARPAEVRTAERLAERPEFDGRTFEAPPPPDPGYDWVDDLGRTYDAMGDGTKSQYFVQEQFTKSIDSHLLKGNDFTVIDMTGYTPEQAAAVGTYIDGLPASKQAPIRRVGF